MGNGRLTTESGAAGLEFDGGSADGSDEGSGEDGEELHVDCCGWLLYDEVVEK